MNPRVNLPLRTALRALVEGACLAALVLLLLALAPYIALMLFYAYLLMLFGMTVLTAVVVGVLLWVELNNVITWLETRQRRRAT